MKQTECKDKEYFYFFKKRPDFSFKLCHQNKTKQNKKIYMDCKRHNKNKKNSYLM